MTNMKKPSVRTNALLSVIKQLFSIIFPMITFPYATRVLGPTIYGRYTFSASIVNYISYIAAAGILRYAIRECARNRDDYKTTRKLVNEIFTINISTTIISYLVLFALLFFVPTLSEYSTSILIISLSVIFTTLGTDWINSAYEDYFFITIRYITSQSVAIALLYFFVRDQNNLPQYAAVSVFGGILANVLNIFHIRKRLGIYPQIHFSKEILKHIKPIAYLFACTIATYIYINSDITILRMFSDDTVVGYYGVSTQFYQLVKHIMNAAFIVFIPRISNELGNNKSLVKNRFNKLLRITILSMIPCSIGLFMIRENLIVLFSGKEYLPAAPSLSILSFSLIPAILANYYINIVMIPQKKEKQVLLATVVSALANILLNFLLIPIYKEKAAAITTLIAEIIMTAIAMFYCKGIDYSSTLKPIIASVTGGCSIIFVCLLCKTMSSKQILNVICCVSFSVIAYILILATFYKKERQSIFDEIKRKIS